MNAKEISSKIRQILQDYHRRDDYSLEDAEKDVLNLIQVSAVMPTITDEEIEAHFTTPHYHYEKGHYYKIRKDRIFGAKWMRDEIRKRMVEVRPIFENHGTQINDTDDEHPTNKEKFDGNYLPDTDENR